jgi:methionyl-tRNA formyltransferase
MLHIWRAWPLAAEGGVPGEVLASPEGMPPQAAGAGFVVRCGTGSLAVLEAQRAGRRAMPSAELLRGLPGLIGQRLGPGA